MNDKLMNKAIFWTFIWVCSVIFMAGYNLGFSSRTVHLNEIGDFVAGAMSPLAIFWLVMVYLQQRKEMREQVEQTQKIATETRRQVAIMDKQFKKQYEPLFVSYEIAAEEIEGQFIGYIAVQNIGGVAINPKAETKSEGTIKYKFDFLLFDGTMKNLGDLGGGRYILGKAPYIGKYQKVLIKFDFYFNDKADCKNLHKFEIVYKDMLGRTYCLEAEYQFDFEISPGGLFLGQASGIEKFDVFPLPARFFL